MFDILRAPEYPNIMLPEMAHMALILVLVLSAMTVFTKVKTMRMVAGYNFCLSLFAFSALVFSFIISDFSIQYVAYNSSVLLPQIYKATATWGAHEGSLLLWGLMLSFFTFLFSRHKLDARLQQNSMKILLLLNVGFYFILLHTSNPFERFLPEIPIDGADLNPLLQDPGFVIHPPILYLGYVISAIPFALALASINCNNANWIKIARFYALISFGFLTLGIMLGSWWAYYELGWGGFWFWDPVENASLMPWLSGAVLVHFMMKNSSQQLFHFATKLMAVLTFVLCLIGTFLVRSGVLTSVHAFASSPERGVYILCLLTIVILFAAVKLATVANINKVSITRAKDAWLLLGMLGIVGLLVTVLLGTLYPILHDAVFKEKISIGIPYFAKVFMPIALFVVAVFSYQRWPFKSYFRSTYFISLLSGAVLGSLVLFDIWFVVAMAVIFAAMVAQIYRFYMYKKISSSGAAHFGFVLLALAVLLTSFFATERELVLTQGDAVNLKGIEFKLITLNKVNGPNYEALRAHISVNNSSTLYPEKRFYHNRELVMTETAIQPHLFYDIYVALGDKIDDNSWSVRLHIKPFVRWVWLSAIIIALGALWRARQLYRVL